MSGIRVRMPHGRLGWVVTAWVLLAAGGLLLFGLSGPGGHPPKRAAPGASLPAPRSANGGGTGQPPGVTTVATVLRTSPRYARPGVRESGSVPATWWERPSALPVIGTRPGWVRVRLAQRPNGSTAWLPAGDVQLGATPYRIVIDLAQTRLKLYRHGRLVLSAPAGVGAGDDPTPPGEYFAAFDETAPSPGYGPFIMVTSAHSPRFSDWEGSGDGIIGIHGPLGEDSAIGTSGAHISHGCVRLHLKALAQLSEVPPGTPIDVTKQ